MLVFNVDHVHSSVLGHLEQAEDLQRKILRLLVILGFDIRRTDVSRQTVLILVLIVIEAFVRDYLGNGKRPVVKD